MTNQRKKAAIRAFTGLAGSPLASTAAGAVPSENPAAVRARARRVAKAAKLAEIKNALRIPLAERNAAAELQAQQDREKAEQQKAHDKAMKPTLREWEAARESLLERSLRESNQTQDALDRRHYHDNGESLDTASYRADQITDAGGVLGGHRVKGQGSSAADDNRGLEEKHITYGVMDPDDNTPLLKTGRPFGVRVGNSSVNQSKLRAMLGEDGCHEPTAFTVIPDSDRYRCACCGFQDDWLRTMRNHVENEIERELIEYKITKGKRKAAKEALGEMLLPPNEPIVIDKAVRGPHATLYHNFKA
jgi:hypothetical protein